MLAVSSFVYAQGPMVKVKKPMSIGEAICSQLHFVSAQAFRNCVKEKDKPFTLPDLRVYGISVSAGRYDNSGFVRWEFIVQVKNTGGTKAMPTGQMPVYTDISFGRVCPEHEYCPENYERLMEEHWIDIPRTDNAINLSFKHEFYDPDGSGTIPKNFYVLVDSRLGGYDCVPGVVIESNEYNNVGYIEFKYEENARNYWYAVYW